MSSHVGEATASPSPLEGLDKRQERYWLIERRCKDLCLYLDVLTRNMPRYELIRKRSLKRLKRKAEGCSLETAMAYLSHAKDTSSLKYVLELLWRLNSAHRPEIYDWTRSHGSGGASIARLLAVQTGRQLSRC